MGIFITASEKICRPDGSITFRIDEGGGADSRLLNGPLRVDWYITDDCDDVYKASQNDVSQPLVFDWDGTNSEGNPLGPGTYHIHAEVASEGESVVLPPLDVFVCGEQYPSASRVEMTEMVLPGDANPLGNALGGRVMHLIDIAAAISATRFCRRQVVTASIDSLDFHHPAKIGQILILKAKVTWAGTKSMEVAVDVFVEDPKSSKQKCTCTAYLTFVALDEKGNTTYVPRLVPQTFEEHGCCRDAEQRRRTRLQRRAIAREQKV